MVVLYMVSKKGIVVIGGILAVAGIGYAYSKGYLKEMSAVIPVSTVDEPDVLSPQDAKYTIHSPHLDGKKCANCRYLRKGVNYCERLKTTVDPLGWCQYYAPCNGIGVGGSEVSKYIKKNIKI